VLRADPEGYVVLTDLRPLEFRPWKPTGLDEDEEAGPGRVVVALGAPARVPAADLRDLRLSLTLLRHRDDRSARARNVARRAPRRERRCMCVCADAPFSHLPYELPRFLPGAARDPGLELVGARHAICLDSLVYSAYQDDGREYERDE